MNTGVIGNFYTLPMDNEKRLELMKRVLRPISKEKLQDIVRARVPEAIKLELLKMSERRNDAEIRQGFADGRIADMTPNHAGEQQLLFIVADRFQISNRGCVLVPGLSTEPGAPKVKIGTAIRLRTPDGAVIDTYVRGIEMINYRKKPEKITAPILLPQDVKKEHVPVGTEVYLLETEYAPNGNNNFSEAETVNSRGRPG